MNIFYLTTALALAVCYAQAAPAAVKLNFQKTDNGESFVALLNILLGSANNHVLKICDDPNASGVPSTCFRKMLVNEKQTVVICPTTVTYNCDQCKNSPCQNGGVCTTNTATNTFTCACPFGYTGDRCQTIISQCTTDPCTGESHDCFSVGYGLINCKSCALVCRCATTPTKYFYVESAVEYDGVTTVANNVCKPSAAAKTGTIAANAFGNDAADGVAAVYCPTYTLIPATLAVPTGFTVNGATVNVKASC